MANILPTIIFPNMTSDGTDLTIPIADLVGLTAAEADPATGDGRELARIIIHNIFSKINALADAAKPVEMIVTKANPIAQSSSVVRESYTISFDVNLDSTGLNLVAES